MGKKRTAIIQGEGLKKKKEIFRWEEVYNDLPLHTATSLREARVKPDQLKNMPDGEVLAIDGIRPSDLETIRAKYLPAELIGEATTQTAPVRGEAVEQRETEGVGAKSKSASSFYRHPRQTTGRSKRYKALKVKVEDKSYSLTEAITLLKEISSSKHPTIELHLNTTETGLRGEIKLPHHTGKQTRVTIFSPREAEKIKNEQIDFDILLATPADMPQIAPLAKFLGPRGLMPNPKSQTIVTDPQKRAQQLQAGTSLPYKTEPKAPIIHLSIGNLNQSNQEILDNLQTILTAIGPAKIKSAFLKSTMSPALKLSLEGV